MASADKPHAVCIPFPHQSHIKATLKLAKLLHHKGFHITFVNTEFNHRRFLKSRGPNSLDGLPDFRFETIPDGLPSSDSDSTQDSPTIGKSVRENFLAPFRDLLAKLNDSASSNVPPVTSIVSDGFMTFTITAAEEFGLPVVLLWTLAACGFMGFYQFRPLVERGLAPLKDPSYLTNGYLDTPVDWIPGMKNMRLKDLPSFFRTTDPNDVVFNLTMEAAERAPKASAIILHTFDALEPEVLNTLSSMFPLVYTIGPLQLLLNQIPEQEQCLSSVGYNLWKEEAECLQWLNSKQPDTVIYVNFGSVVVMKPQEVLEFGLGLANSNHSFLWVIRSDLVVGDSAIFEPEFLEGIKERGFISGWCPQEQVLNHPSIGGFLTHSGWNSIVESLSAGVPMICWPVVAEQQTNCLYACSEWGIGMEIDGDVRREKVEKVVRELMDGEEGKKMKKRALEWKRLAEEATRPLGSSALNLDKLLNGVLMSKS
ncbi:7-deoxyloganetin glucosyltransferase-like [Cornus florida]|uniref:7-deoxyloganetin glucosyltransferase-like n=1 Tax=Cornus florida TaxID=4283 RepID=UPI0028985AF0|nr:7-deoxyloganetin glucosyltransferase-like [Cornus florida]